jgi:hypothetical protein
MLPERNRADVVKEIRSLLQDALEAEAPGGQPTEAQVLAVLRQFGPPREMAMRYGASQYSDRPAALPDFHHRAAGGGGHRVGRQPVRRPPLASRSRPRLIMGDFMGASWAAWCRRPRGSCWSSPWWSG